MVKQCAMPFFFSVCISLIIAKLAGNLAPHPLSVWAWHEIAIARYEIGRFSPLLEALPFHGGAILKL